MADPGSTSFIPKRAPKKRSRTTASRQVYVFTLVSYTLIFAALIAAVSVFFYHRYLESQLASAVSDLNTAIASFEVAEMERVLELDSRLRQADERVDFSASTVSLLEALEAATVASVQVEGASIERRGDAGYVLSATLLADDFDSTLFQRSVLEQAPDIANVDVANLSLRDVGAEEAADEDAVGAETPEYRVSVDSELTFDLDAVQYEPNASASGGAESNATGSVEEREELRADISEPRV
jgi:hypothetical protein